MLTRAKRKRSAPLPGPLRELVDGYASEFRGRVRFRERLWHTEQGELVTLACFALSVRSWATAKLRLLELMQTQRGTVWHNYFVTLTDKLNLFAPQGSVVHFKASRCVQCGCALWINELEALVAHNGEIVLLPLKRFPMSILCCRLRTTNWLVCYASGAEIFSFDPVTHRTIYTALPELDDCTVDDERAYLHLDEVYYQSSSDQWSVLNWHTRSICTLATGANALILGVVGEHVVFHGSDAILTFNCHTRKLCKRRERPPGYCWYRILDDGTLLAVSSRPAIIYRFDPVLFKFRRVWRRAEPATALCGTSSGIVACFESTRRMVIIE